MSATDQMRQMIDQLMGTDAQSHDDTREKILFDEFRVCRAFLLGCCPHETLSSTRMDMGDCHKYHDIALRADFQRAQKEKDFFYDLEALDQLERFFGDCDRKMNIAKQRLAETQEELSQENSEKAEKVLALNEDIGKTLAKAEQLGAEGKVDESLKLMEQLETLKKEKQDAEQEYRSSMPASSYQQQKLRVCEVCSAYLGIHDNDRRLADHFGGKLHMGFVFLREKLAELRSTSDERRQLRNAYRNDNEAQRNAASGGPTTIRDRDEDRRKRRSRDRSRERDRPRGGRGSGTSNRRSDRDEERNRKSDRRDKDKRRRSRSPRDRKPEREGRKRRSSDLSDVDD